MRKKFLGCALATALSVLGLIGCGAGDTETVTSMDSAAEAQVSDETENEETDVAQKEITWATWGNEGELKRFEELNEAFMKANPDVKVNFIPIPNNGYMDKLLAMIASGTEPDVYYIASGYHSLALEGKLEPLDSYMENDSNVNKDNFFPNLLPYLTVDGQLYGLPVDTAPRALYYNKTMLKELGLEDPNELEEQGKWDINAFEEMAGKISDAGKIALVLENNQESNVCWFGSSGASMYDENGKCIINSPESVAIYTKMQNMIKDGKIQWNANSKIDPNGLFMGQQLAFVEAGRWLMPLFKDIKDFEFDVCPIPAGLTGDRTVFISSIPLGMSANSKDKETAWRFMSYFLGEEGQTFRLKDNGNCIPSINLPGLDEATFMNEPLPEHKEIWKKYREEGVRGYVEDSLYPEAGKALSNAEDEMFVNFADVQTTLQSLQDQINQIVSQ